MTKSIYPKEWQLMTLGDLADWGSGGTPSRKNTENYGGNIPWIKTGDLGPRVLTTASEFITPLGVKKSSAKYFPKGSVAIAMYGATIGRTSILGIDATTNQACAVGQPVNGVTDGFFLYYLLLNEKDAFIAKGKGGAQPNISQKLIKEHPVAAPPLTEQKVITEKLDTLLAQVDATKARLERIPPILKRFRQSVLATVQYATLINSKRLGSAPETSIGDLCIDAFDGPFGSKLKSSDYSNQGVGVVRLENIKHLSFDEEKRTYISDEKYEALKRNTLKKNDILFSSFVDEEIRTCLFPYSDKTFINKADCFCLRVDPEKVCPEFLLYLLASPNSFTQIKKNVQGVTRPRVNLKLLKSLSFNIPDQNRQTEIVRRVEHHFAYADIIERQVNAALEHVNSLTQSILAKAFRGELTEQWRRDNPDLISGENSAEALLARIQVERAGQASKKRARKSKATA